MSFCVVNFFPDTRSKLHRKSDLLSRKMTPFIGCEIDFILAGVIFQSSKVCMIWYHFPTAVLPRGGGQEAKKNKFSVSYPITWRKWGLKYRFD